MIVQFVFQPLQTNEHHVDGKLQIPESSKLVESKLGNNNFNQHSLPSNMFNENFTVKIEPPDSMYDMDTPPSHAAEDMSNVDGIRK